MPRLVHDQTFDQQGQLVEEHIREKPARVIDDATFQQAKQNLRTFWQTYTNNGTPTGTPTAAQTRNAILSLIVAARWLYNEMDDEA